MAHIASIPPTAPQAATQSSPAGGQESLFSPHLQTAIANTQPSRQENSTEIPAPPMKGVENAEDNTGNSRLAPFLPLQSKATESKATPTSLDLLIQLTKSTDNDIQNQRFSSFALHPGPGRSTVAPDHVTLLTLSTKHTEITDNTQNNQQISSLAQQPGQGKSTISPYPGTQLTPSGGYAGNNQYFSTLTLQSGEQERKVPIDTGSLVSPTTPNAENGDKSQDMWSAITFPERVATEAIHSSPILSRAYPAAREVFASESNGTTAAAAGTIQESGIAKNNRQEIWSGGQMLTDVLTGTNSAKSEKIIPEDDLMLRFQEVQRASDTGSLKPETGPSSSQMVGFNPKDAALLVRLNEIINNSSETRGVSITGSTVPATPGPSVSEPGQAAVDVLAIAAEDGSKLMSDRSDQQSHPLRHNVQQQYYQAKIQSDANGENAADRQNTDQNSSGGNAPSPQAMALADKNSPATAADPVSTLPQTAAPTPETAAQASSDTARQVILPSGTYVREDHVVQQFMERFQVARRLAESKIHLKLHPAELGELKIDLSVKEGSIKASVVTQNQQVQEIIERNIAKLRTMLEGQGYSLDAVTVTSESDSVGDFDLFDKQLFSQNEFSPSPTGNSTLPEAFFDPESIHVDEKARSNGVNVRI